MIFDRPYRLAAALFLIAVLGYGIGKAVHAVMTRSLVNRDERLSKARHDFDLSSIELLNAVSRLITVTGIFCVILPFAEAALLIAEAIDFNLYCNKILRIKPLPSSPVKRMLMEFGREKRELQQSFLTIESTRHKYTEEYKQLTADFYLDF